MTTCADSPAAVAAVGLADECGRLIAGPTRVANPERVVAFLGSPGGRSLGPDVLARNPHRDNRPRWTEFAAKPGLVVEDAQSGWVGAVVRIEYGRVDLEDRHGRTRGFPLGPGFLLDGRPVILIAPPLQPSRATPTRTASGSVAVPQARARMARAGRIYVEGRHDAELVEKVWGDDLRVEGVVVEYLGGVDDLARHRRRVHARSGPPGWECSSTTW